MKLNDAAVLYGLKPGTVVPQLSLCETYARGYWREAAVHNDDLWVANKFPYDPRFDPLFKRFNDRLIDSGRCFSISTLYASDYQSNQLGDVELPDLLLYVSSEGLESADVPHGHGSRHHVYRAAPGQMCVRLAFNRPDPVKWVMSLLSAHIQDPSSLPEG